MSSSSGGAYEEMEKEDEVTTTALDTRIKQHLDVIQDQINAIDWYFKEGFTNPDAYLQEDIEEYISNPINVFVMIKRGALYWPYVKDKLNNQTMFDEWDQMLSDIQYLAKITENQIEES